MIMTTALFEGCTFGEKTMKKFFEKNFKNRELILKVAEIVCEKNKFPVKMDYVNEIAEQLNSNSSNVEDACDPQKIRTGVSKAMDKLVAEDVFARLYTDEGKVYYVPNEGENIHKFNVQKMYNYLEDKIIVKSPDLLLISNNVCALLAEPVDKTVNVKEVFETVFDEYCFYILNNQALIYIMLKDSEEDEKVEGKLRFPDENSYEYELILCLSEVIRILYNKQNPPAKIKLKKKPRKIIKKKSKKDG